MIRFQRPTRPSNFGTSAKRPGPKGPFDERIWGAHKAAFSRSQHGKCGYCETYVAGTQDGDVEHFAPKQGVHDVDARARGIEAEPGIARLRAGSRKTIPRSGTGYWWLAYDWTNFLLACRVCNAKYKGLVFPLDPPPPPRWKPTRRDTVHRPLLLNCFDDDAPWRHLRFVPLTGDVVGRTPRGAATIDTCGLHRETLRVDRHRAVQDALGLCNEILAQESTTRERARAWDALLERGGDARPFAGAVRSVAEERLGLTWDEIAAAAGPRKAPRSRG